MCLYDQKIKRKKKAYRKKFRQKRAYGKHMQV